MKAELKKIRLTNEMQTAKLEYFAVKKLVGAR
jgi:hypothetical protein